MRKFLRLFLFADLPVEVAFPLRFLMTTLTMTVVFIMAGHVVADKYFGGIPRINDALRSFDIIIIVAGATITLAGAIYAKTIAHDYEELKRVIDELSKGNLDVQMKLSPVADRDLIELAKAIERLRASLKVSLKLAMKSLKSR